MGALDRIRKALQPSLKALDYRSMTTAITKTLLTSLPHSKASTSDITRELLSELPNTLAPVEAAVRTAAETEAQIQASALRQSFRADFLAALEVERRGTDVTTTERETEPARRPSTSAPVQGTVKNQMKNYLNFLTKSGRPGTTTRASTTRVISRPSTTSRPRTKPLKVEKRATNVNASKPPHKRVIMTNAPRPSSDDKITPASKPWPAPGPRKRSDGKRRSDKSRADKLLATKTESVVPSGSTEPARASDKARADRQLLAKKEAALPAAHASVGTAEITRRSGKVCSSNLPATGKEGVKSLANSSSGKLEAALVPDPGTTSTTKQKLDSGLVELHVEKKQGTESTVEVNGKAGMKEVRGVRLEGKPSYAVEVGKQDEPMSNVSILDPTAGKTGVSATTKSVDSVVEDLTVMRITDARAQKHAANRSSHDHAKVKSETKAPAETKDRLAENPDVHILGKTNVKIEKGLSNASIVPASVKDEGIIAMAGDVNSAGMGMNHEDKGCLLKEVNIETPSNANVGNGLKSGDNLLVSEFDDRMGCKEELTRSVPDVKRRDATERTLESMAKRSNIGPFQPKGGAKVSLDAAAVASPASPEKQTRKLSTPVDDEGIVSGVGSTRSCHDVNGMKRSDMAQSVKALSPSSKRTPVENPQDELPNPILTASASERALQVELKKETAAGVHKLVREYSGGAIQAVEATSVIKTKDSKSMLGKEAVVPSQTSTVDITPTKAGKSELGLAPSTAKVLQSTKDTVKTSVTGTKHNRSVWEEVMELKAKYRSGRAALGILRSESADRVAERILDGSDEQSDDDVAVECGSNGSGDPKNVPDNWQFSIPSNHSTVRAKDSILPISPSVKHSRDTVDEKDFTVRPISDQPDSGTLKHSELKKKLKEERQKDRKVRKEQKRKEKRRRRLEKQKSKDPDKTGDYNDDKDHEERRKRTDKVKSKGKRKIEDTPGRKQKSGKVKSEPCAMSPPGTTSPPDESQVDLSPSPRKRSRRSSSSQENEKRQPLHADNPRKRRRKSETKHVVSDRNQPSNTEAPPSSKRQRVNLCSPDFEHKEDILRALQEIMKKREASAFLEPVDSSVPSYFSIIKHPMDLGTITSRLTGKLSDGEHYLSLSQVLDDIELVVSNCRTFNGKIDVLTQHAESWSRDLLTLLQTMKVPVPKEKTTRRRSRKRLSLDDDLPLERSSTKKGRRGGQRAMKPEPEPELEPEPKLEPEPELDPDLDFESASEADAVQCDRAGNKDECDVEGEDESEDESEDEDEGEDAEDGMEEDEDEEDGINDGSLLDKKIAIFTTVPNRPIKAWQSVEVREYSAATRSYTLYWPEQKRTTKNKTFGLKGDYAVYRS